MVKLPQPFISKFSCSLACDLCCMFKSCQRHYFFCLIYATSMHSRVWLGQVRPGWAWLGWVGPLVIWGACPVRLGLVWMLITSKPRVGHLLMKMLASCKGNNY
jgi:hypothetical protein